MQPQLDHYHYEANHENGLGIDSVVLGCPKNMNSFGKNSSALKSGKSTNYTWLDKEPNVKFCWKLTELFAPEDMNP